MGSLKREELIATNSMVLHEFYFANLGGDGKASGTMVDVVKAQYGSVETWEHDFRQTGLSMNASLLRALRPDGFVAVIDFNPPTRLLPVPDGVPENRRGHGMPIEVLIEEMSAQAFAVAQRIDDWFRFDYCVVFQPRGATTSLE